MSGTGELKRTGRLARRLGWFVLLWLAGVLAVSILAYGIRLMIVA